LVFPVIITYGEGVEVRVSAGVAVSVAGRGLAGTPVSSTICVPAAVAPTWSCVGGAQAEIKNNRMSVGMRSAKPRIVWYLIAFEDIISPSLEKLPELLDCQHLLSFALNNSISEYQPGSNKGVGTQRENGSSSLGNGW
jgi:hypothetical protein